MLAMIATNVIGVFYVAPTNLGTIFVVVALVAVIVLVEFARFLLWLLRIWEAFLLKEEDVLLAAIN